ncbi:hypothetical protein I5Q23_24920 [Serratia marcescens]|nr:hypothetical protein [Serratia marcescens]
MQTINLVTPRGSILLTKQFINSLSETTAKMFKQALKYLEAESVVDEIQEALDYLKERNNESDYFRLRLLESGIITTYGIIFNDGLNLSHKNLIPQEGREFHKWLMELRNRYCCHSDLYITSSFNMLHIDKTHGLMLSAGQYMRVRPLSNENIDTFKLHVDIIKRNLTKQIRKLETWLIREITSSDWLMLKAQAGMNDSEKLNIHLEQQNNLRENCMMGKG